MSKTKRQRSPSPENGHKKSEDSLSRPRLSLGSFDHKGREAAPSSSRQGELDLGPKSSWPRYAELSDAWEVLDGPHEGGWFG